MWSSGYTAFGQSVGQLGSTNNHYAWGAGSGYRTDGFGPADASPLMKVGARYYDPEFGCFLTRDTDLSQLPYVYCGGDPVNCTDPSGHLPTPPPTFETTGSTGIIEVGDGSGGDGGSGGSGSSGSSSDSGSTDPSVTVTTSGLSSTATVTSASDYESVSVTANNGNPTSVTVGGTIPLGSILNGLSFTFSDLDSFGGMNQQSAGLGYQSGIFKVAISGNSAGGWMATAGISTH